MTTSTLNRLSELMQEQSDRIIREWTLRVLRVPAARELDRPALIDHMPHLIDEISQTLQRHEELSIDVSDDNESSEIHGTLRFQAGFDIVEVVAEYNALREVLHEFAERRNIPSNSKVARVMNRTIDHAIAFAVKAYATEKTLELQRRREEHFSFLLHDLKTPLAAIQTVLLILESRHADRRTAPSHLWDLLKRNSARLHALLSKVLQDQANLQMQATRLECREFDVWPLAEGLIQDCQPLADAVGTKILNDVPEDLWMNADAHAIARVLQNLISNAIEHTPQGQIRVGGQRVADGGEVWVKDSGAGISSERLGRIFEKLETDHNREGGLGLGLAIVKDIVEAHGGNVVVDSTEGQGAIFKFTISDRRPRA